MVNIHDTTVNTRLHFMYDVQCTRVTLCVCVNMGVRVYVCVYVWCMNVYWWAYVHVCYCAHYTMYQYSIRMRVCRCVRACARVCVQYTGTLCMLEYVYALVYVHVRVCVYMFACACACAWNQYTCKTCIPHGGAFLLPQIILLCDICCT